MAFDRMEIEAASAEEEAKMTGKNRCIVRRVRQTPAQAVS
jgi:hypothetical protein